MAKKKVATVDKTKKATTAKKKWKSVPSSKLAKKGELFKWDTTETEVTKILNEELTEAWEKLRSFAEDLGPQRIYPSAQAIMFAKKLVYFFARPKKTHIEVWILLPHKIEGLKSTQPSPKKFHNLFKLIHADQVEEPLTDWLREAYEISPEPK